MKAEKPTRISLEALDSSFGRCNLILTPLAECKVLIQSFAIAGTWQNLIPELSRRCALGKDDNELCISTCCLNYANGPDEAPHELGVFRSMKVRKVRNGSKSPGVQS